MSYDVIILHHMTLHNIILHPISICQSYYITVLILHSYHIKVIYYIKTLHVHVTFLFVFQL